jgi:riboflavin synthase
MFTGLVSATGSIVALASRGPGLRLSLRAPFNGETLAVGESIAVDGCCLSVASITADGFEVDASAETVARTTLGRRGSGGVVNLERALRMGERVGGHWVTGHIDAIGELVSRRSVGEAVAVTVAIPQSLRRFVAEKGSIAVNGVSLTVNAATDAGFEVTLIPITLAQTNLGRLAPGDCVNLEVDLIARYVARLLDAQGITA